MNTQQVADMFGVKPRTVRQWVYLGQLAAWEYKGGSRLLFHSSDVTALLRRKEAKHG